jgi:predicted transcriptional regulator
MTKKKPKASKAPKIGQEEFAVLRFIQDSAPITVREVADHFAAAGKARTTVMTVMERLRAKRLLSREKIGGSYRYRPCVESTTMLRSLVDEFVHNVLGGSISPFVAYMSDTAEVSDEEVKQLKQMVRELDKKRRDA